MLTGFLPNLPHMTINFSISSTEQKFSLLLDISSYHIINQCHISFSFLAPIEPYCTRVYTNDRAIMQVWFLLSEYSSIRILIRVRECIANCFGGQHSRLYTLFLVVSARFNTTRVVFLEAVCLWLRNLRDEPGPTSMCFC